MAEVTLEQDKKRLIIKAADYEEGQILMGLPSRRWMPSRGVFVVPLTRLNAKTLNEAISDGRFEMPLGEASIELGLAEFASPRCARAFPPEFAFRRPPFPDQLRAIQKIYPTNAGALFMRPGSGKSFVAINMFSQAFHDDLIDYALVLCPLTVTTVWAGDGQVAQFSPLPSWSVGTNPDVLGPPQRDKLQWLVIGIESLSQGGMFARLMVEFAERRFALLVDESSRIANRNAYRTQRAIELGKLAKIRLIATGTPALNTLEDLYAQFEFLDSNIIGVGDFFAFRNRYCRMGGYKNKEIVGYNRVDELMGLIEPYTYRCDKPEGLPDKLFTERVVQMTEFQRKVYNDVKNAKFAEISVANILNRVIKLQQVIGGHLREDPKKLIDSATGRERKIEGKIIWELRDHNPKLMALQEFLDDIGREQCVIWCKFLWEIDLVVAALGDCVVMTGATPVEERGIITKKFQDGKARFFVGNAPTGGLGITLTAAHYCVYYSNTFSLEDRIQSEDRLHRIGQHSNVLYVDIRMDKSVDTLVFNALKEKKDLDRYLADKLDEVGQTRVLELLG